MDIFNPYRDGYHSDSDMGSSEDNIKDIYVLDPEGSIEVANAEIDLTSSLDGGSGSNGTASSEKHSQIRPEDESERRPSPNVPIIEASQLPEKLRIFRGHKQPDPVVRLQQAKNFLSDEDFHRALNFKEKMYDIEAYIEYLEENEYQDDGKLMKTIKEMIEVHKDWIKEATQSSAFPFTIVDFCHSNRLVHLIKDHRKRNQITASATLRHVLPKYPTKGASVHSKIRKMEPEIRCLDPFYYTKEVAKYRRTKDHFARDARLRYAQDHADDAAGVAALSNFNGPYTSINLEAVEEALLNRQRFLSRIWEKLADVEWYAPRALLRDVLVTITNTALADPKTTENFGPVTKVDINFLLILALPSRSSRIEIPVIEPLVEYDKLVILAHQIDVLVAERAWAGPNATIEPLAFLNMLNDRRREGATLNRTEGGTEMTRTFNWTFYDLRKLMPILHQARRIRWEPDQNAVRPPVLDIHPEDTIHDCTTYDPLASSEGRREFALKAARCLGRSIATITRRLATEFPEVERVRATEYVKNCVENPPNQPGLWRHNLVDIALTLVCKDQLQEPLDEKTAARILQEKVIQESNLNWEPRWMNSKELWSFIIKLPPAPKQFFSIDWWPAQFKAREKQMKIEIHNCEQKPRPPIISRKRKMARSWDDPGDAKKAQEYKEKYIPGECIFPFGETVYQQAAASFVIEQDLMGVPVFGHLYESNSEGRAFKRPKAPIDMFALPKVNGPWKPTLGRGRECTEGSEKTAVS